MTNLENKIAEVKTAGFKPMGTYVGNAYNKNPTVEKYAKIGDGFKTYGIFLSCGCTDNCDNPTRCGGPCE